jgi:hypothetical protein
MPRADLTCHYEAPFLPIYFSNSAAEPRNWPAVYKARALGSSFGPPLSGTETLASDPTNLFAIDNPGQTRNHNAEIKL